MRRDRGVTLVELTVVIAIIGVITTVISGGIVVLLRSDPVVSQSIGQSHDQQQLLNYLYEDTRATESVNVNTSYELLGYTRDPAAPGCGAGGSSGLNVLQLTWRDGTGLQRSSYRLTDGVEGALLQRDHCSIIGSFDSWPAAPPAGMTVATTNIADRLDHVPADWDNSGEPAHVTVDGDVLTMVLAQSGRDLHASATLRADLGLLPPPPTTVPSSTTAVPTTTTVPEPPTTSSTTTAPPATPVTSGICSLLANITAVVRPAPVGELLRSYGADGLAGPLVTPVRIDAGLTVGLSVEIGTLQLDVTLCATVQLAYNTGAVPITVPMLAEGQCTVEVVVPAVTVPIVGTVITPEIRLCTAVEISLHVELPASDAQQWTTGTHVFQLVDQVGNAIANSSSSLEVKLDASTVPPPPITVPTVGQGEPLNPLAAAQGFSVMVEGDADLVGATVHGGVAAGGDASFSSASVAATAAAEVSAPGDPSPLGLMVGGAIHLTATPASATAVANGFVHAGSLPDAKVLTSGTQTHIVPASATGTTGTPRVSVTGADQTDQVEHPVMRPLVFPFTNTFLALDRSSEGAAALTPTNCPAGHPTSPPQPALEFPEVYKQSGNSVLNIVPGTAAAPAVNVLNLTSKQLEAMTSVTGTGAVDASTALVINVTDHGNVSMTGPSWALLTNGRAQSVLWNFPNANRVTIGGTLRGSVLAPTALVTLSGATLHGDVIGESLTTSANTIVNVAHFDQELPCIG